MFYKMRRLSLVIVVLVITTLACAPLDLLGITQPEPEIIIITVEVPSDQEPIQPTPEQPTPEEPEPPTAVPPPPPPTAVPPTLIGGQLLSCVSGPHWVFFKWIDRVDIGEEVILLAKASADWDEYYFVEKGNGATCWVYGASSQKFGDYQSLPIREAPPLPDITYKIKNRTELNICDVFIRPENDTAWGTDWLGSNVIPPGGEYNFDLTAGFYDVLVVDCLSGILFEEYGRAIGSDSASRETKLANEVEFYIKNNFAFDICWVNVMPNGGLWDEVYKESDGHVQPGEKIWITLLAGIYEIQIHDCTGTLVDIAQGVYVGPTTTGFTTP